MKLFRKFLSIINAICVLFIIVCFSGCSKNNKSDEKFKVGMECSYAPFNWIQPNEDENTVKVSDGWHANGYDVYVAQKIADGLNRELEIVKLEWDGLLPALTSGKIDAIIAGMSATEERKKSIDFTDSYYVSNMVLVVKKNGEYSSSQSINEFSGAKITGQMGTVHYDLIDQIIGVDKRTPMDDFSSMVSSLNAGKIDGFVCEKPAALMITHSNPNLMFIDFKSNKGFNFSREDVSICIGLQKNSDLKSKINKILSKISDDEKSELMNKAVQKSYISE